MAIEIPIKPINMPKEWKINWHHLVDLEPDNDLPIEGVFMHFDEDISYLTYQDYIIDIGFYGGYNENNRKGNFGVFIAKGDFSDGLLYANITTRSVDEVVKAVETYAQLIANGEIEQLTPLPFNDSDYPDEYSALDLKNAK